MSGNDAPTGRDARAPDGDLAGRLKRLDAQLGQRRETARAGASASRRSVSNSSALGRAFRMSTEFIAGILAGGGLGWLFDRLLGTSPFGLIVLLMLGFVAGILNLLRAAKSLESAPKAGSEPPRH